VSKLTEKILTGLALAISSALVFATQADAASSCAPSGLPTTCVIDAASNSNSLDQINSPTTPFVTGRTFDASSTYVLTVANPLTATWTTSNITFVTADGNGPGLTIGSLVGQVGGAGDATGAFKVSTVGALAVGGVANGTAYDGRGNSYNYSVVGGSLSLAVMDTDLANNSGTQAVTITKAPTVGGNVLANVNVFAGANGLGAPGANLFHGTPVDTGLILAPGNTYGVQVTDANHIWTAGSSANRYSTADGIDPVASGFGLCGVGVGFNENCGADAANFGAGEATGFRYGELVAVIGGKYYGVGNARNFSGLSGDLSFLYWDSFLDDNAGFMNVTVFSGPVDIGAVPEPASLAVLASGLAGLAWSRRRRRA